jgi:beta-lactamase class A
MIPLSAMSKEKNTAASEKSFRPAAAFFSVAVVFFLIGFLIQPFYARYAYPPPDAIGTTSRGTIKRLGTATLINPLLECEIADKKEIVEFEPLHERIEKAIAAKIANKKASRISVYFRGMKSGRWVGIGEDETYPGGSLIKIPFLFAYYKLAEQTPEVLKEQVTYKGDFDQTPLQTTRPSKTIKAGNSYSINELLYRMIVYSGNNSTVLLMRRLDRNYLNGVFGDLGVPKDQDSNRQWVVTTKTFSSFFRVLYNGTYLSHDLSQRALELLTQTEFAEGLVAGVPPTVKVAHKFGEEVIADTTGRILSATLHDCGIVYHADHAYFLCVMTEGAKFEPLKEVISSISSEVYRFVDSPDYPIAKPTA